MKLDIALTITEGAEDIRSFRYGVDAATGPTKRQFEINCDAAYEQNIPFYRGLFEAGDMTECGIPKSIVRYLRDCDCF